MHAATREITPSQSAAKQRALLVSRISMLLCFVAIAISIIVREERGILVSVVFALIPAVIGPGAYRFVGIFAAIATFLVHALIALS